MKDRYLDVTLRVYVNEEDSTLALEKLLEDVEIIIDRNGRLAYVDSSSNEGYTRDIIITYIDTDQGALSPLGVGEMTLQVKYA
jgi:16S rRNA C1402 N4-methylase RsmH